MLRKVPQYALDDAATAALWALGDQPTEQIGLLYEQDGIARTPTASAGGTRSSVGTFRIPSNSLRGLFHNHPARDVARGAHGRDDKGRSTFSSDDTLQSRTLGVPSYISVGQTVLRYDPETKKTEEVLALFPWEEQKRRIMAEILGRDPDDPRGALK